MIFLSIRKFTKRLGIIQLFEDQREETGVLPGFVAVGYPGLPALSSKSQKKSSRIFQQTLSPG